MANPGRPSRILLARYSACVYTFYSFPFFAFFLSAHILFLACARARSAISLSYFLIPIFPAFLIPRMHSPHPSPSILLFPRHTDCIFIFSPPPPLTLFLSQHLIFITASYPNSLVFLVTCLPISSFVFFLRLFLLYA